MIRRTEFLAPQKHISIRNHRIKKAHSRGQPEVGQNLPEPRETAYLPTFKRAPVDGVGSNGRATVIVPVI